MPRIKLVVRSERRRNRYPFHRLRAAGDRITIRESDVTHKTAIQASDDVFASPREAAHAYARRRLFKVSTHVTVHGNLVVERA